MPTPRNFTPENRAEPATVVPGTHSWVTVVEAAGTRASLLSDSDDCRLGIAQDIASTHIPLTNADSLKELEAIQTGFELIRKWRIVRFSTSARSVLCGFDLDVIHRLTKSASELTIYKNMESLLRCAENRYLDRFSKNSVQAPRLTGLILTIDELKLMEQARDKFLTLLVVWDPVMEIYEEAKYCLEKYVKVYPDFRESVPIKIHRDAPNQAGESWGSLFFNGRQGDGALSRSGLQFWGEILKWSERPISVAIVDQYSRPHKALPTLPPPLDKISNQTTPETGSLIALKQSADRRWNDFEVTDLESSSSVEEGREELIPPHLW